MDYTIAGSGVNLASRLEHLAPAGGILISYETYALVKDSVRCEERGHVEVRGIAYPIATYQVVDQGGVASAGAEVHEDRPHIRIDLDLNALSDAERQAAIGMLQRTLIRLTGAAP
jgi:hypothetical protein